MTILFLCHCLCSIFIGFLLIYYVELNSYEKQNAIF